METRSKPAFVSASNRFPPGGDSVNDRFWGAHPADMVATPTLGQVPKIRHRRRNHNDSVSSPFGQLVCNRNLCAEAVSEQDHSAAWMLLPRTRKRRAPQRDCAHLPRPGTIAPNRHSRGTNTWMQKTPGFRGFLCGRYWDRTSIWAPSLLPRKDGANGLFAP